MRVTMPEQLYLERDTATMLVIDPKPFVGDRAYDATQHLLGRASRLLERRVAAPGEVDVVADSI